MYVVGNYQHGSLRKGTRSFHPYQQEIDTFQVQESWQLTVTQDEAIIFLICFFCFFCAFVSGRHASSPCRSHRSQSLLLWVLQRYQKRWIFLVLLLVNK